MLSAMTDILNRVDGLIDRIPMLVLLVLGVPMLVFGADKLVDGSVAIARKLGVSTLVIGLSIVAAGTSAPELAVNIIAAVNGNTEISFGNVIGSNIVNIGLVVAIGAMIAPMLVHTRVVQKEIPWLLIVTLLACALPFMPWSWMEAADGSRAFGYTRLDGAAMAIGFFVILGAWYRASRADDDVLLEQEAQELVQKAGGIGVLLAVAMFCIGLAMLVVGGRLTQVGAVKIALSLGLSEALIGMTIVAVATSLPELVTTIVACKRGHTDLAVGNVVGSNVFNILLVLGVTALIADVPLPPMIGWQDLIAMTVMTMLLWWFSITNRRHVTRGEGVILFVLYVGYVLWSIMREL